MKYNVSILVPETIWNTATLEVEASSKQEAIAVAKHLAEEEFIDIDWQDIGKHDGVEFDRAIYEVEE